VTSDPSKKEKEEKKTDDDKDEYDPFQQDHESGFPPGLEPIDPDSFDE